MIVPRCAVIFLSFSLYGSFEKNRIINMITRKKNAHLWAYRKHLFLNLSSTLKYEWHPEKYY